MRYFEDFLVGEVISSRGRTITEADIVNFCMFSGDWYPLHSDVEYARKSVFGGRIAHGFLVLSATSGLMPLTEWAIVAFYGIDKLRFMAPTKIGDTLRVDMEVLEKKDKDAPGGVVAFGSVVKNQRDEDVAKLTIKIFIAKREFAQTVTEAA